MDWKVRFIDFPAQFRALETEIMGTIHDVLANGDLILRRHVSEFEGTLARFVGTDHAVGVSSCTDALRMVLHTLDLAPGDEVITVAHTFVATAASIHHAGATPILVDVGDDHVMDVSQAEAAITPRTRAIIPVHLNGRLCDMDALMKIADRAGIPVLEDAAQALGGSFNGTKGGAFGIAGTFSFYPAKMLGAYGDAGAITLNDPDLAARLTRLRDHARATKNDLAEWGFNCRIDNLQAALLDIKLARLPGWIERRRELAGFYDKALDGVADIRRPPAPTTDGPYYDVYQNYVIEAQDRDALKAHLEERGVETLVSWPKPMHHQEPLGLSHFMLPRTEELSRTVISLPLTTELHEDQIYYVAEQIQGFYGGS